MAQQAQEIITTETCESCESPTEFTRADLNKGLMQVTAVKYGVLSYEGLWKCDCGFINSTIGQAGLI